MGTNDVSTAKNSGDGIDETWYNDLRAALKASFVGRDGSTGAVAAGQSLGTAIYPWGTTHITTLIHNGSIIDFTDLSSELNGILSGQVISTSKRSDFLRANGAAASLVVAGATTDLVLNINGTATVIVADLTESGLTLAPSSNNTATINDSGLTDQESSKWQGEDGTVITITSAGTEITNRIGEYAVFKKDTEYMLAFIESATELSNVYRGYFLDSSGVPIERVTLANSDTLTIMSGGWIFMEDDGAIIDVTYVPPTYSVDTPGSPATGDYWFDLVNGIWKRYSGAAFVAVNKIPLGIAVIDTTNCVATRSFDFNKVYNSYNPIEIAYVSNTVIEADTFDADFNIYGIKARVRNTKLRWDITTDLESGVSEGANTTYYAYITEEGEPVLSDKKPYDERAALGGWYHPYNSWQSVGFIQNNGSSNFDINTLTLYRRDKLGVVEVEHGGTGEKSYTNGQILIGNSTENTLKKATLTSGTGINITNGGGSILIANTAAVTAGQAKAWVNFNGEGTLSIRDSFNVSSVTDNGTGDYTVNFTTAFANTNYAAAVNATAGPSTFYLTALTDNDDDGTPAYWGKTTGSYRVNSIAGGNGGKLDMFSANIIFFGDQ